MQDRHLSDKRKTVFRQRGSGHLAVPGWFSDTEPGINRSSQREPAHEINRRRCRVHVDRALKLCGNREGFVCDSQGQNRIREIRPSGIAGGPGETWPRWNCEPTSATERAELETLRLNVGAPQFYPDPTGKENSESILASSLAGDTVRWRSKRR